MIAIQSYIIPQLNKSQLSTEQIGGYDKIHLTNFCLLKQLVAGLLGVESAQDAVIRNLLYIKANATVEPYNITVADLTARISDLRNKLGCGSCVRDEGIVVPPEEGAEGKIAGNVIAGDEYSLAFDRTPKEILKIVYGDGSASVPGGFFPKGGGGRIARSFLDKGY